MTGFHHGCVPFAIVAMLVFGCCVHECQSTLVTVGDKDNLCMSVLRESFPSIPENFSSILGDSPVQHIPFRGVTHPHPHLYDNTFFPLVFQCIVHRELFLLGGDVTRFDVVQVEKIALEEMHTLLNSHSAAASRGPDLFSTFLAEAASDLQHQRTHNRRFVGDFIRPHLHDLAHSICEGNRGCLLLSGLLSNIPDILVDFALRSVNDIWTCVYNTVGSVLNIARSVWNRFTRGEWNFDAATIPNIIEAVITCGRTALRVFTGPTADAVLEIVQLSGAAITCIGGRVKLEGQIVSNDEIIDYFDAGALLGECGRAALSRRDTSNITVPDSWSCPPQFYGQQDGCDVNCGAFDPDCYIASQATHATDFHPSDSQVPDEWICPLSFYNTSDGCDRGCGVPDPDCLGHEDPSTLFSIKFTNPKTEMSVYAEKMYEQALDDSSAKSPHSFSHAELAGVIVGTAFITLFSVFVVIVLVKKYKSGSTPLNTEYSLMATST